MRGVVGGEADHRPLNRALVGALWPALWGHSLANVWGYATQADELGAVGRGEPRAGGAAAVDAHREPAVRAAARDLAAPLARGRRRPGDRRRGSFRWCASSSPRGPRPPSARPRSGRPDALRDLVRNPTATRYAWRWMMPTTLAHAVVVPLQPAVPAADLGAWWTRQAAQTPRLDAGGDAGPAARLGRLGPRRRAAPGRARRSSRRHRHRPPGCPGSPPRRWRSCSRPDPCRAAPGRRRRGARACSPSWPGTPCSPARRPWRAVPPASPARSSSRSASTQRSATETETWAARLRPTDLSRRSDPAVGVRRNVVDGLQALAGEAVADIDRGLRAALDTATHRLDPWATAIAWRRLQDLAAAPRTLGVYGWVDAPRPRGVRRRPPLRARPVDRAGRGRGGAARPGAPRSRRRLGGRWTSRPTPSGARCGWPTRHARAAIRPSRSGRMVEAIVNRPDVIDRLRARVPDHRSASPVPTCGSAACATAWRCWMRPRTGPPSSPSSACAPRSSRRSPSWRPRSTRSPTCTSPRRRSASSRDAPPPSSAATAAAGRPGAAARLRRRAHAAGGPGRQHRRRGRPARRGRADGDAAEPRGARRPGGRRLPRRPRGRRRGSGMDLDDARRRRRADRHGHARRASGCARATPSASARATSATSCATSAARPGSARRIRRGTPSCARSRPLWPECRRLPRTSARRPIPAARPRSSSRSATRPCATRPSPRPPTRARRPRRRPPTRRGERRSGGSRAGGSRRSPPTDDPTVGGLADRVRRAAEVLERRIGDAPATLSGATVSELASAIAALVAPEGPCPVFARLPAAAFAGMRAEPADRRPGAAPGPGLAGDGGAGSPGAGPPRGGAARPAHRRRRATAASLDEPPRRSVADGRPAAVGRRRSCDRRGSSPPSARPACCLRGRPRRRRARWPSP